MGKRTNFPFSGGSISLSQKAPDVPEWNETSVASNPKQFKTAYRFFQLSGADNPRIV